MSCARNGYLQRFRRDGYIVIHDVIDAKTVALLVEEMNSTVLTPLLAEKCLHTPLTDMTIEERIQHLSYETGKSFPQHFDFSLPQNGITNETPIYLGTRLFETLRHANLIDNVSALLESDEITSNPVQHMRVKLPQQLIANIAEKSGFSGMVNPVPWHQDAGVILPEADGSNIITCWVALTDVSLDSGCMQVIPQSHTRGILQHCHTRQGLAIPDSIIHSLLCSNEHNNNSSGDRSTDHPTAAAGANISQSKAVALPMSAGSVLFMHQQTVHSSLENTTQSTVRISMDLRYQVTGTASGRPLFESAGFIVRSRLHPERELRDHCVWRERWVKLREALAGRVLSTTEFNRWPLPSPTCV